MMNDIVLIVLSLSISGSFMALLLFIGKPIFKKHTSKACSYYIWLLVLLRLVIPFSFDQSVTNQLFNSISSNLDSKSAIMINNAIVQDNSEQLLSSKGTDEIISDGMVSGDQSQQSKIENDQMNKTVIKKEAISVQGMLVIIWLIGAWIALLLCVIPYMQLKFKIKDTNADSDPEDIAILHNLGGPNKIRLKYNSFVSTPMLIGIISPCIVIPGCNYVKSGKKQELENILCHELMHYSRKDLIYKWFTVVVTSLHWFNPLMIPIRRQISCTCELSCDEAVIRNMNVIQKQSYGETLLSMTAGKRLSAGILATTLCEEKKELEERLLSIMKYKKQTSGMLFLSIFIVAMLTGCGTILGSVSKADTPSSSIQEETPNNDIEDIKSTGELKWYGETNLISDDIVLPSDLINTDNALNDFLDSDKTIALLATNTNENIYVYGLKENGSGGEEDYSYYCHGICIRQGNEIQVLDIDWGIYGDIPQIQYEDYDNDGQKELAMILKSASGTGLSLQDLHILKKSDDGGFVDYCFTDWADQLSKMETHEVDNGILKLFVNGEQMEQIDIAALEDEWGEKFKDISFGTNVEFLFQEDEIYLQVLPEAIVGNWLTPQRITDTNVQMKVLYHGGFELSETSSNPLAPESDNMSIETEIVEDVADETIEKYLNSPNGKLLKQTTDNFVKAYFSNEKETAYEYLVDNAEYESYVYKDINGNEVNIYGKLIHLLAKWYTAADTGANVQYEYEVEGEDAFTYLDISLEYKKGNWVITGISLEK